MKNPSLSELQNWLAWKISGAKRPEPKPACAAAIADEPPISRDDRIEIYENAYLARLVEILESDFEGVARVVGEDRFWDVVADYLDHFPSASPSVADLGRHFPSFLLLNDVSVDFPFLYELATFEWALCQAVYTENSERDDPSKLAEIPQSIWLQARVTVDRSLKAYKFEWPITEVWKTGKAPERKTTYVIVFHADGRARFEQLPEELFRLIRFLQQGASIEASLEQAGFNDPQAVSGAFRDLTAWGLLAKFDFSLEGCD